MATCMKIIAGRYENLVSRKRKDFSGAASVEQLSALMQKMPQFQKEIKNLQLHMGLSNLCDKHYDATIDGICDVEQDLVTKSKKDLSNKEAINLLIPYLIDQEISKWSKMRIILLYAIQRNGVRIEELQSLVKNAGLSQDDQEILESLVHLNIPVIKDCLPDTKKMPRKDYTDDIKFSDSRYIPLVKDLMQVIFYLIPINIFWSQQIL